MNALIQQLADQAKKSVPHGLTPDKWIEVYNEKFAELIVQECAEVCLNPNHWYEDAAGETFNRVIKQHFGVEE